MGYEGDKNNPRYSLFSDSLLRHRVTIRVGINFKPKNPVEVLDFHKIQVRLNISRICTPKIRERVLGEITLCLIKGGGEGRYATAPWIYKFGLFEEARNEITIAYQIGYCNNYLVVVA